MPRIFHMPDELISQTARRATFKLQATLFSTTNPFTGFDRRTRPNDLRWEMTVAFEQQDRKVWAAFDAFETEVRMHSGFFTAYDPSNYTPQGRPLPRVTDGEIVGVGGETTTQLLGGGGFQTTGERIEIAQAGTIGETQIQLRNMLGRSRVFEANDLFTILHGPHNIPLCYKVLRDAVSDGTEGQRDGTSTISFGPGLRHPVVAGDEVIIYKPRTVFQFVTDPTSVKVYPLRSNISYRALEAPEAIEVVEIV